MLKISLNGDWVEVATTRLSDAMAAWQYSSERCAVAINGKFVPRSEYPKVLLSEGDLVDVVSAVGGG
jgi:sulfur carrier protein